MGTLYLLLGCLETVKADLRPFQAKVAAACADGSASAYTLNEEGGLDLVKEWREPRLKTGQKYVGITVSSTGSRYVPQA